VYARQTQIYLSKMQFLVGVSLIMYLREGCIVLKLLM
jgi:hypothetical protein